MEAVNLTISVVKPRETVNLTSGVTKPSVVGDVSPEECKVSSQNVPQTSTSVVPAETTKTDVPQTVDGRKEVATDVTKVDSSDAAHHIDTVVEATPSSVSAQTAADEAPLRQTNIANSVSSNIPDETPLKTANAPSSVSGQTPHIAIDETPQRTTTPSSVSAETARYAPKLEIIVSSISAQTARDEMTTSVAPSPHQEAALAVSPLTLHEGVNLDIIVTEVISPSLFWVQPLSSKLTDMMSDLM